MPLPSRDPIIDPVARNARASKRMADGSLGGRTNVAGPVGQQRSQQVDRQSSIIPPFTRSGAVATTSKDECAPWLMRFAVAKLAVTAALAVAGTSSTVITVYKNGTSVGAVTLASSATSATATLSSSFSIGDVLQVAITTAGAGAMSVTVLPRAA